MKILLIDNYDSFTFNLFHYLSSLNVKVDVIRNDKITSKEILFGKLVHGGKAVVDVNNNNEIIINYESKTQQ